MLKDIIICTRQDDKKEKEKRKKKDTDKTIKNKKRKVYSSFLILECIWETSYD